MKLLLVSHGSGPYGAERVLLAMARGLADRGHQVVLDFPHDGPAVKVARGMTGIRLRVGGRPRLPRGGAEALRYLISGPSSVLRMRQVVAEEAADLVWVNSLYNPWAALGARMSGRPVVWHLHERGLVQPFRFLMAMLIGLVATRVVVVSEWLAASYGQYPPLRQRLRTIWNPLLEQVDAVDPPPREPFTVGCIGQLERHKRVLDLVAAVALLEDVRTVFIGSGKAEAELVSAIQEAGIQDRAQLLGYQSELASQLARLHCVAIPGAREAFGLVGLEALAAGVPVVAARAGALPEVLGDAAVYHEPGDPADLARQIDRLRSEPELSTSLRRRGLERVAGFGREPWLDRLESVIRDAAGGKST